MDPRLRTAHRASADVACVVVAALVFPVPADLPAKEVVPAKPYG